MMILGRCSLCWCQGGVRNLAAGGGGDRRVGERKLIIILRFSVDKFVASGLMRRKYDRVKPSFTTHSSSSSSGRSRGTWGTRTWARQGSPLIAVLCCLVGAPWEGGGGIPEPEQRGGQERGIISLVWWRWWVGVADNNASLSSRSLHNPVVMTGSQTPVIMSWVILVMIDFINDDVGGDESDLPDLEDQDHDGYCVDLGMTPCSKIKMTMVLK
jgi:hypothetical protein